MTETETGETETAVRRERPEGNRWLDAAVAGLAAGAAFGLYLQLVAGVLPPTSAASGVGSLATDWAVHLLHSLVFALVYAELSSWPPLARYADRAPTGAVLGAGYGVVLWAVATGVAVAFWALANTLWILPVPSVSLESLAGHVLFGVILGAGFAIVRRS
jgi:hypothetical protein